MAKNRRNLGITLKLLIYEGHLQLTDYTEITRGDFYGAVFRKI